MPYKIAKDKENILLLLITKLNVKSDEILRQVYATIMSLLSMDRDLFFVHVDKLITPLVDKLATIAPQILHSANCEVTEALRPLLFIFQEYWSPGSEENEVGANALFNPFKQSGKLVIFIQCLASMIPMLSVDYQNVNQSRRYNEVEFDETALNNLNSKKTLIEEDDEEDK
jgi:hypothetical protein